MSTYVDIDPTLQKVVKDLQLCLDEDDWMLPEGIASLSDPDAYTQPLSTQKLNVATAKGVSDPGTPGSSGDMTAGPLQVDMLDSMRRALLARHCYPWNRQVIQAEGRDKAQASPQGPLATQLTYLQNVIKQGSGEQRT